MKYNAIVIGTSSGGVEALKVILKDLGQSINVPIIIVIHTRSETNSLINVYAHNTRLIVDEAIDKAAIENGHVYFAPPGYHLSIEDDFTFSLSIEEKINFSRPSIDILFKSAAEAYKENLLGILLTGANNDGATGLKRIEGLGGKCIVQDPKEAYADIMPLAGINEVPSAVILKLSLINKYINRGEN